MIQFSHVSVAVGRPARLPAREALAQSLDVGDAHHVEQAGELRRVGRDEWLEDDAHGRSVPDSAPIRGLERRFYGALRHDDADSVMDQPAAAVGPRRAARPPPRPARHVAARRRARCRRRCGSPVNGGEIVLRSAPTTARSSASAATAAPRSPRAPGVGRPQGAPMLGTARLLTSPTRSSRPRPPCGRDRRAAARLRGRPRAQPRRHLHRGQRRAQIRRAPRRRSYRRSPPRTRRPPRPRPSRRSRSARTAWKTW